MATVPSAGKARLGDAIVALAASDGTVGAPWPRQLAMPGATLRDLADAVHSLCSLYGGLPGLIDHAHEAASADAPHPWLDAATAAFATERALLATLTAAVGPLPSTPGAAAAEAAVIAQRHALAHLASSGRAGCAIGAAAAFLIDWHPIRDLLDGTAVRVGVEPPSRGLPDIATLVATLDGMQTTPGIERAMNFGAQQMLAQHRGLWQLLEARASARRSI